MIIISSDGSDNWTESQRLNRAEYENPDAEAKNYFDHIAEDFKNFCNVSGKVLDIGCGRDYPKYVPKDCDYTGLDPERAKDGFPHIQAMAENIPCLSKSFDWVLSGTSLDHIAEPRRALAEIKRVLKASGYFGLWVAVVDQHYFRRGYSMLFSHPREGLHRIWRLWRYGRNIDKLYSERTKHHAHFYREQEVYNLLKESGFRVLRRMLITDNNHGHSLFVLSSPFGEGIGYAEAVSAERTG